MKYSVIIPTYNSSGTLQKCLVHVQNARLTDEIIIADGGSDDDTQLIAERHNIRFVRSDKGRGIQLQKGAECASGDVFVFLHSDTYLPSNAKSALMKYFRDDNVEVGSFRMRFDHGHWLLKVYGFFTRFDSIWTNFGDQCIVCTSSFYKKAGGFPAWRLFEDVYFLQKARKLVKIHSFPVEVVTSSEQYLKNGILKQQFKNGSFILQYLFGTNPQVLSEKYGY